MVSITDCRGNMTEQECHECVECAGQWDHVWRYDCDCFTLDLKEKSGLDCYQIEDSDFRNFEPLIEIFDISRKYGHIILNRKKINDRLMSSIQIQSKYK